MMEFWLISNDGKEKILLPVPPAEFEISQGNKNTVIDIHDLGEINLLGNKNLATITLSSFFPAQQYTFVTSQTQNPYTYVNMIKKWQGLKKPIRLVITQTNINMLCSIENFSYGEKDGSGDVYYTIELKEYRTPAVQAQTQKEYSITTQRSSVKEPPKTYVVKKGDTLWMIAKKLTGKGENWTIIAKKNNIKDPKKIYPGQKLVI